MKFCLSKKKKKKTGNQGEKMAMLLLSLVKGRGFLKVKTEREWIRKLCYRFSGWWVQESDQEGFFNGRLTENNNKR